jgi:GT2 family glycosyltransferase
VNRARDPEEQSMTGASSSHEARIAAVLIGRNEGARLVRALASAKDAGVRIVYVDSGSTDDSLAEAAKVGADIVELDMSKPFTAARALAEGWIATAFAFLEENPQIGAVCGRRRERFPEATVYNRLCDIEWDTPVGRTKATGGDVMMRAEAFEGVGGFNPTLIAGEEPELCVRLRAAGWEIWRLDHEMTLHDADMTRFGQWWKRARRGGHAFAEGAAMHGAPPERHFVPGTVRALVWGLAIPLLILLAWIIIGPVALLGLLIYPVQVVRLALRGNASRRETWEEAFFSMLIKFPETLGALEYGLGRLSRRPSQLIEYK